ALTQNWRFPVVGWGLALLGTVTVIAMSPENYADLDSSVQNSIIFLAISGGSLAITLLLVQRDQIRTQLDRERRQGAQEQARRELVEERARIARELHDVVAHGMSVIQVQASSAKYRLPEAGPAAAAEFDDIAATARGALGEMRQLLGVLRGADPAGGASAGDPEQPLGPQPGLFDLPALVETTQRAGVPVTLSWDADSRTPATVGLTAYRVVQESLSNIIRHAPGAPTRVEVRTENGSLRVEVRNDAPPTPGPSAHADAGGHGLRGMRERVELIGGTLEHGPTEDGGYRILAELPDPAQG
ncbi:sensor histidine kinase, partial [Leucobacter sp. M11]|uniref:sensor histidine kinase n=1 Tax=Leucobacter sp. M11 TaxID=2993565 RepID=UPI002D7F0847